MEVDEDIEAGLLRQFNCLNTSDKDVLIKELQGLLGNNTSITEQSAKFYLDMADWNLQAAVGAYFDLQSSIRLPQMSFIQDVTIGEGESVPPNTSFIKTWRVSNSGGEAWPTDCHLQHTGGERFGAPEISDPLACLSPNTTLDISMQMTAPERQGLFSSKWRMTTVQGHFFGDTIWVIIQVDDGGTLALMQQMVNLKELGSSPPEAPPPSPSHAVTSVATSAGVGSPPSTVAPNPFGVPKNSLIHAFGPPNNSQVHTFGATSNGPTHAFGTPNDCQSNAFCTPNDRQIHGFGVPKDDLIHGSGVFSTSCPTSGSTFLCQSTNMNTFGDASNNQNNADVFPSLGGIHSAQQQTFPYANETVSGTIGRAFQSTHFSSNQAGLESTTSCSTVITVSQSSINLPGSNPASIYSMPSLSSTGFSSSPSNYVWSSSASADTQDSEQDVPMT